MARLSPFASRHLGGAPRLQLSAGRPCLFLLADLAPARRDFDAPDDDEDEA